MKRIYLLTAISVVFCAAACAQNDVLYLQKVHAEQMSQGTWHFKLGMMGPTVKGAPYSAEGSSETAQTLADGTHIKRQESYTIYRDGEGRVRRESGDQVWISDPVSGVTYLLDTTQQTARKMSLSLHIASAKILHDGHTAKVKAESAAGGQIYFAGGVLQSDEPKPESLGRQEMEGVAVDGTRSTVNIPVGEIGNDRPIQIVSERWESPDLHVTVFSKHTDPTTGDSTERLTNIRRGEPDPALFQVPANYTIEVQK